MIVNSRVIALIKQTRESNETHSFAGKQKAEIVKRKVQRQVMMKASKQQFVSPSGLEGMTMVKDKGQYEDLIDDVLGDEFVSRCLRGFLCMLYVICLT